MYNCSGSVLVCVRRHVAMGHLRPDAVHVGDGATNLESLFVVGADEDRGALGHLAAEVAVRTVGDHEILQGRRVPEDDLGAFAFVQDVAVAAEAWAKGEEPMGAALKWAPSPG